jgi:hypothetical protein
MNLKIENIGNPTVELERGPYLQTLTENSVKVKWRTNVPVNSIVNYGLTSGNLNSNETDPGYYNRTRSYAYWFKSWYPIFL